MSKCISVFLSVALFISVLLVPIDVTASDVSYLDHYVFDFTNAGYFTDQLNKADGSGAVTTSDLASLKLFVAGAITFEDIL